RIAAPRPNQNRLPEKSRLPRARSTGLRTGVSRGAISSSFLNPTSKPLQPHLTLCSFPGSIRDELGVAFNPPGGRVAFIAGLAVGLVGFLVVLGPLLFLPAGTLSWPRAWYFIRVNVIAQLTTVLTLLPGHLGLLDQRLQSPIQPEQPLADRIFVVFFLFNFIA